MVLVRGLTPTAHLQHIFALSVFEDFVYWTDWETNSIERCHKYTGKENKTILSTIHRPMDIQVSPIKDLQGRRKLRKNREGDTSSSEKLCF